MFKKIVVGCLLLTLACPTLLILGPGIRHLLMVNSLHTHQERWSELGIDDYRFVLEITEIFPHRQVEVLIEVRDGQRASIIDYDSQVELTEVEITDNFLDRCGTIGELFEAIDKGVRGNFGLVPLAMWFTVQFDDEYHYPTMANLDHVFLFDGGIKYRVLDLEPLQ
jgi:hypothetical protein